MNQEEKQEQKVNGLTVKGLDIESDYRSTGRWTGAVRSASLQHLIRDVAVKKQHGLNLVLL